MTIEIIPSILSADFSRLSVDLDEVQACGIRKVQVDVMDGHFVPNITVGQPVVRSLAQATDMALDVHLMIEAPGRYVDEFVDAGATVLTIHAEAERHLHRVIHRIRDKGVSAGVALNPATSLCALDEILPDIDVALIMTVNPGFGGQSFIPSMIPKIERLAKTIADRGLTTEIQVDGGIDPSTAGAVVAAGATQLVAGSAVFGLGIPVTEAVERLRTAALAGRG